MYKPTYTITDRTARYLTEVAEARTLILSASLVPKWEVDLRRQALINSTFASTSIEGNQLSLEQVSDLMVGREITAVTKDKKEVVNYFDALGLLDMFVKHEEISEKDILVLHGAITKDVLRRPETEGKYRTIEDEKEHGRIVVGSKSVGGGHKITFMPPEAEKVPKQMRMFVAWLNSYEIEALDPVIHAGIAHYEFVRIHPFVDGNGRTARVLASLVLLRRGFDTKRFFTLDDFYNSDRQSYYKALQTVDPKIQDLTFWLEYFCEGVAVSINAVKDKVEVLTGNKGKGRGDQIALDVKEMKLVEFVNQEEKITNRDVQNLLSVSSKTAHSWLQKLVTKKVLKKVGKGRGVHYVLG